MNKTFIRRFKSLLWRISMMAIAFAIAQLAANLDTLHLSPEITVLAGLILGEISKFLNTEKK